MRIHKHCGITKKHPVSQEHKDAYARKCHNAEVRRFEARKPTKKKVAKKKVIKKKTVKKPKQEKYDAQLPVVDGFIICDMTTNFPSKLKGIEIKVRRTKNRKRTTVTARITT